MVHSKKKIGLLCAVAIIGVTCINRTSHPRYQHASLHGFYGDTSFVDTLQVLLPPEMARSPLPYDWKRSIPTLNYAKKYRPLYIDKSQGGTDYLPELGLESSTLAFYAGHGKDIYGKNIYGWQVPDTSSDDWVPIKRVHVGDQSLRYFWLYSCNVMAHGPQVVESGDYSAPQCFKPHRGHADVFERWTHAFASDMRMVCGGSTGLGQTSVDEIWNYLLETETSVADAWLLGLTATKQVPVCLARGGQDPASSALADRTIYLEGVTNNKDWLHLEYPVRCRVKPLGSMLQVTCGEVELCATSNVAPTPIQKNGAQPLANVIETLPVVNIAPPPPPDFPPAPLDGPLSLGFFQIAGNDRLKFHPKSKAKVLIKRRDRYSDRYSPLDRCDRETSWIFRPKTLLARTGVDPDVLLSASPDADSTQSSAENILTALEMRVESRKDGEASGHCRARSLFLLLHHKVDVGTKSKPEPYPIFGPATVVELQRSARGLPVVASYSEPYRGVEVAKEGKPPKIKGAVDAIRDAYQELQLNPAEYPVDAAHAVLGYEQAPLRCSQKFLRPTYEIQFFPTAAAQHDRPTVIVRRDARLNTKMGNWTCSDWGKEDAPEP